MKKAILIALAIVAAQVPSLAPAQPSYNVLLAGGTESNAIHIWLTDDGRDYVIDSMAALEVGGSVCVNPNGNPNELICPAPPIASFEVNADGGDDKVSVSKNVTVPVTMRGGSGHDRLRGGKGPDKLIGGNGDDRLVGWWGDDLLVGGNGDDVALGGPGDDIVVSGKGDDVVRPGAGDDVVRKEPESHSPEQPSKR
jgi:Ca2+-binding RTX toxin-like protein